MGRDIINEIERLKLDKRELVVNIDSIRKLIKNREDELKVSIEKLKNDHKKKYQDSVKAIEKDIESYENRINKLECEKQDIYRQLNDK